ncbi:hypothetical protein L1987_66336 [Smallanthus sonchifolius]|uniref:Uncharacterized protein n=1 Tax=Smallanthus sonchifolius TaxID=185202 RepID=A0ACB9BX01_9ASTR|nr:hypothetical protein L1987_66336 [Smallanthus sonchifolius]
MVISPTTRLPFWSTMVGGKELTPPTNNANQSSEKSPHISEDERSDHTPSLPLNTESEDHLMPRVFNNKRKAQASVSPVHSRPEKIGLPDLNEINEEGRHFKIGAARIRLNRRREKPRKKSKTANTSSENSEEEEDQMEDSMVEETQMEKGQGEDRSGNDLANKESDLRDSIQEEVQNTLLVGRCIGVELEEFESQISESIRGDLEERVDQGGYQRSKSRSGKSK